MACSFQGVSLCYSFFCLLVSSVSGSCPDTKGMVEDTFFFRLTCSVALWGGREGVMLQTNNTGVRSQCLSHTGSAPTHSACSLPAHTARALGCSAGTNQRPALGRPPRSKAPRFRHLGSPQRHRLSVGPAFSALPRSEELR